jgi:N-acetylneuraminic acid mutarotase
MPTGRQGVAVVSAGGLVYAIGGVDTNGTTTGAVEAYDPVTDSWTAMAAMPTPRTNLGAVAVGGKIYAIGGFDSHGTELTTTEVYTPGSNSWVAGPSLVEAQGGLAVASSGGRIFAIGGSANPTAVEALTPGGSWANVAPLPSGRYQLAAATAADGRIIVMGGYVSGAPVPSATAEAYDPASDSWSSVAPMSFGRVDLAAATGSDGRIYAIGGDIGDNPFSFPSVEAYDPTANAWTLVSDLAVARNGLGATLGPDGRIYAIGGSNELDASAATAAEAYTPPSTVPAGWTLGRSLPAARWGLGAAVSQNGTILVAGGESSTGALLSTTAVFNPATNTWSRGQSLPAATYRATLTPTANGVHLTGGWGGRRASSQHEVDAVWSFGAWEQYASVPGRRELAGAAVGPDGSLYVVGGDQGGTQYLSSAERYAPWQDQASDRWTSIASLATPRTGGVLASGNDGRLYLIGGLTSGGYVRSVKMYDPTTNTWSSVAPLPDPRFAAAGLAGPDGRIYVMGGIDPVAGEVRRLDIYSPATNTWTCGPPMPSASSNLAAALFNDSIYALGGIRGSTALATTQIYHVGAITPDPTPPTFTTPPTLGFPVGWTLGASNVPVQMRWHATASATDIRRYAFAISANGGGFTSEPLPWDVISNVADYLPHGRTPNQIQITATDCTGNVSAPSLSSPFAVRAFQETSARYTGSWKTGTLAGYYGGHTRYATRRGARARYTFTGQTIALVSERRPNEGQAYIAIDGKRVATINLHSTTTTYREVVYSHTFATQGTHTIWVTVRGTAHHPRIDIDAFTQIQTTHAAVIHHATPHPTYTIIQPTITPNKTQPTHRTS